MMTPTSTDRLKCASTPSPTGSAANNESIFSSSKRSEATTIDTGIVALSGLNEKKKKKKKSFKKSLPSPMNKLFSPLKRDKEGATSPVMTPARKKMKISVLPHHATMSPVSNDSNMSRGVPVRQPSSPTKNTWGVVGAGQRVERGIETLSLTISQSILMPGQADAFVDKTVRKVSDQADTFVDKTVRKVSDQVDTFVDKTLRKASDQAEAFADKTLRKASDRADAFVDRTLRKGSDFVDRSLRKVSDRANSLWDRVMLGGAKLVILLGLVLSPILACISAGAIAPIVLFINLFIGLHRYLVAFLLVLPFAVFPVLFAVLLWRPKLWQHLVIDGIENDGIKSVSETDDVPKTDTEGVPKETEDVPKETEGVPKETEDVPKETEDGPKETEDGPKETEDVPKETEDVPKAEDLDRSSEDVPKDEDIDRPAGQGLFNCQPQY